MISNLSLSLSLQLALQNAAGSFFPPPQQGTNTFSANLRNVSLTAWNQAYLSYLTLSASATQTIDLTSFADLLGNTVTLNKVFGLFVQVEPQVVGNVVQLTVEQGASNGLAWFFGSGSLTISGDQNLLFVASANDVTGVPVSGTSKTVKFANTGSNPLNAAIAILGGN